MSQPIYKVIIERKLENPIKCFHCNKTMKNVIVLEDVASGKNITIGKTCVKKYTSFTVSELRNMEYDIYIYNKNKRIMKDNNAGESSGSPKLDKLSKKSKYKKKYKKKYYGNKRNLR